MQSRKGRPTASAASPPAWLPVPRRCLRTRGCRCRWRKARACPAQPAGSRAPSGVLSRADGLVGSRMETDGVADARKDITPPCDCGMARRCGWIMRDAWERLWKRGPCRATPGHAPFGFKPTPSVVVGNPFAVPRAHQVLAVYGAHHDHIGVL